MANDAVKASGLPGSNPPAGSAVAVGRFAVFSHRNFTIFWLSFVVTNTGTWMAAVAEGWLITDLEPARKSFYVGLMAIAFAAPMMILPPFGGVLADRLPRLTALRLTQIAFLIINSSVALLALLDRISVPALIGASFLAATVLAFDSPIRHAMVPDLVPRAQLTSAVSINAVAFSGAGLIGPALGGFLIPLVTPGGVFLINAVSSISVLVALQMLKDIPALGHRAETHGTNDPRSALNRAYRYMRDTPLLLGLFLMALVAGFFGRSYGPMLPVMSRDVYHVGSTANGLLFSAAGLGAMAGGLGLSAFSSDLSRRGGLAAVLIVAQGALMVCLAVFDSYAIGLITLVLMGALGASAVALIMTLVQEHVPPEYRGRVVGFFLLTFISFPSAGAFLMGLVADVTSIQRAIGLFAALVLVGTAALVMRNPVLLITD